MWEKSGEEGIIDPAEKVRRSQRKKNVLLALAEKFQGFLAGEVKKETGIEPHLIAIHDVNFVAKAGRSARVNLVNVNFRSEQGIHKASLAVKFFKEREINTNEGQEKVLKEFERALELYRRLEGYEKVRTPKPLYNNPAERVIVYEGIRGHSYLEVPMDRNKKAQLAGYALAIIHGSTIRAIDIERLQKLSAITVIKLPISKSKKEELLELIKPQISLLENSSGGAMAFGDFHANNIMFSTGVSEKEKKIEEITWIIDPEYFDPEEEHICRFEDIGIFYAIPTLEEYIKFGTLYEVYKDIEAFLQGYDSFLLQETCINLEDLYPEGIPLDFHIALGNITYALDLFYQKGDKGRYIIEKCIKTAEEILRKTPFSSLKYRKK